VIGFGFGTLTMGPVDGEWNSGEKIPVTLVDSDANKNTKVLEHLTVNDPNVALITALKIGTPFTLEDGADFAFVGGLKEVTQTLGGTAIGSNSSEHFSVNGSSVGFASGFRQLGSVDKSPVQLFSQRAILNTTFGFTNSTFKVQNSGCSITSLSKRCEADSALVVDLQSGGSSSATQTQKTLGNVQDSLINTNLANTRGLNMFNYDIRSLNNTGGITNVKVFLLVNTTKSNSTGTFTTTDFKIAPEGLGTSLAGNSVGQARTDASLGTSAGFGAGSTTKDTGFSTTGIRAISIANATTTQGLVSFNVTSAASAKSTVNQIFSGASTSRNNGVGLMFLFNQTGNFTVNVAQNSPIVADFFSFGLKNDGNQESERTNNAIYRLELEETGASTGTYTGTIEYLMLNQLNIFDPASYAQIRAINYQVKFIAHEDLIQADARAVRLNYLDLGSDGVSTQIAAQQDAPTHSGVVSFDNKNYKVADTVTITLKDQDLNVDNDKVDIYTTVATTAGEPASDTIGSAGKFVTTTGSAFGRLLDIQFGQTNARWQSLGCGLLGAAGTPVGGAATGLSNSGFTLVETGPSTGQFTGTFQIPDQVCLTTSATDSLTNANGLNIKVNYVDFRDASGKTIEISDRAGVRGTTGSVKLDRTVYPVPFGALADFTTQAGKTTPNGRSVFPLHLTGISGDLDNQVRTSTSNAAGGGTANVEEVGESPVIVHIRVNDRDFDISAAGEDKIQTNSTIDSTHTRPPVKMTVTRGTDIVTLATAGTPSTLFGPIGVGSSYNASYVRSLGPLTEIAPDAGIFQVDLPIFYTDGPASTQCPATKAGGFRVTTTTTSTGLGTIGQRFLNPGNTVPTGNFCIRQGDVLTVEYTDPVDSSGNVNTVTDSATFDLRNGVLQSDKSVYIIGSDMILTLIEPDFNLDSQTAETKNLDLIELDSHAKKTTMGQNGAETANFDAKPTDFRETGKDTGIFQSVIKIPKQLATTLLERGEQIHLEYTDWGPAGAKVVGDENQDIKLTIYTSNFGATVELDQKVYTWTDKVYITVVAPDHNFDSNLIDTIGDSDLTKVTVSTRGHKLSTYKLVETGVDTGIFTGEVILTGFAHAVDEATPTAQQPNPRTTGTGPTSGFLESSDTDGLTVSFLYTKDQTVTGSALIRWNIGEVQFVEASYPANGQGVLRIIDPDMNLNPEAVDKFDTNMWSDSDSGGIKLTMTETNEATGIFEGTVYFTTQFQSSGNRLKTNEGDTVTGEYLDKTLPAPYTPADQLRITGTTFIGTIVPPLERAPASNPRVVDAFGNELKEVKVDQQIQITA
ncbi:MAG: hypothetical protein HY295_03395, partial [Thaumarchaeota archaeon]|nr:hypothetical protein [Nitrososphaerota archaeon]